MNSSWRKKHLESIKQKAGARYTPSLNVELPISEIFDGIGRTKNFYFSVREKHGKLLKELKYLSLEFNKVELQQCCNSFKKEKNELSKILNAIKTYNIKPIPWKKITDTISIFQNSLDNLIAQFEEEKKLVKNELEPPHPNGSHRRKLSEKYDSYINDLRRTYRITYELRELSQSSKASLSNNPFLLLSGPAGNGKTHLLCDLVEHRLSNTSPNSGTAFLVFGENFNETSDVWSQIISQLNLAKKINNKDELLTELNSWGIKAKSRSLLIIDALNETHYREFWKNNLGQIVNEIKKYPHIGFIISVRSGFENEVLKDDLQEFFTKEIHTGFAEMEWEAVNKFFKESNLPLPEIPLLVREFQNPLFLLIFCKSFEKRKNKTNKQIFRGHEGFTYIFEQFVKAVSRKLEEELGIDHGPKKNIWDTVIEKLAEAIAERMINDSIDRISESDLVGIITTSHPSISNPRALIQSMERNLLIAKVPHYKDGKQTDEFNIRFSFQKFGDHLIGRYIFKNFRKFKADQSSSLTLLQVARKFFRKSNKIGKFLSKSWNRGIIEALSIQCPEQLKGIEFVQVVPYLRSKKAQSYFHEIIDESFVESLVWRKPDAFQKSKKQIINIINRNIFPSGRGDDVFNAFLSISGV
jgi:chromosome condensin MukBEF MukE localization factor